jgi:antitoxin YefM
MIGIKQRTRVGSGGTVMIQSPELPEGVLVEVIVLIEPSEQDTTDYLLSTEANRQHLLEALDHIEHRQDLVVITPEEWHEKYCL